MIEGVSKRGNRGSKCGCVCIVAPKVISIQTYLKRRGHVCGATWSLVLISMTHDVNDDEI